VSNILFPGANLTIRIATYCNLGIGTHVQRGFYFEVLVLECQDDYFLRKSEYIGKLNYQASIKSLKSVV
jgi:hypothetical protein